METIDIHIPASSIVRRYESLIKEYQRYRASLRWWEFRQRYAANIVITLLRHERDKAMTFAGAFQPIIGTRKPIWQNKE